jgi:hypothetical protein
VSEDILFDDLFGQLVWDYEFHVWRGRSKTIDGIAFQFEIETGAWQIVPPIDDHAVDRRIAAASRETFIRIRDGESKMREHLVTRYVPLYAQWHDKEQIAPDQFQARLQLESVEIASTGSADIYYGDDDMFYGHCLIAHFNEKGAFNRGEMFG